MSILSAFSIFTNRGRKHNVFCCNKQHATDPVNQPYFTINLDSFVHLFLTCNKVSIIFRSIFYGVFFAQCAIITCCTFIWAFLIKLYLCSLQPEILSTACNGHFISFICIFISFQHILCVPKIAQPFFTQPQEMTFNKDTNHPFNSHSATPDLHNLHHFST